MKHPKMAAICGVAMAGAFSAFANTDRTPRPAEGIQDNSFLIEEAYNQGRGEVQHILTFEWNEENRKESDWTLTFTQEWPVVNERHQLAYAVPYTFIESGGTWNDGVADIELAYRYQLFTETDARPAVAPTFGLILPTGDRKKGLGRNEVGYSFGVPASKVVSDRWTVHANAGLTLFPDVKTRNLLSFGLGGSVVYALRSDFNLLLELVGDWEEDIQFRRGTDRDFSGILSPGARYAFNFGEDAQLVLGVGVPIGLNSNAPDYGVFLYLSFEHIFARPKAE
jgi:hypothetical protein